MRRWHLATAFALAAVFLVELYRALTQGLMIDEARLYLDYIRPDPAVIFQRFDAGHHILQTYLSWIFARRWGWSEFVLRVPSVLASIGYLAFCLRFARRVFAGHGPSVFAGAILLAANALFLDAMVMARGYGLALALFAWSLELGIESLEQPRRLTASGILAALSAAANLTFGVPAAALMLTICVLQRRRNGIGAGRLLREYVGPAFVCGTLLVMLPMTHMRFDYFYAGAATVHDALVGTIGLMFTHGHWRPWIGNASYSLAGASAMMLVFVAARRRFTDTVVVTLSTLVLAMVGLMVSHLRGFPYPTARTAIALLFLMEVSLLAGIAVAGWPRRLTVGLMVLMAAALISGNDPRAFGEWRFDARTKEVAQLIRQRQQGRPGPYRVTSHNDYAWTLNYYRLRYRLNNMEEVRTGGPYPDADYYLLHRVTATAVSDLHLQVIWQDDLCECLLAVRPQAPHAP